MRLLNAYRKFLDAIDARSWSKRQKKLVERYGDGLVCVRYRYDAERRKRIKTVELIEEDAEWGPSGELYLVQIDW
jgi:hypothetical protein